MKRTLNLTNRTKLTETTYALAQLSKQKSAILVNQVLYVTLLV